MVSVCWCAGVGVEEMDGEGKGEEDIPPLQSELALAGMTLHEIISSHFPDLLS